MTERLTYASALDRPDLPAEPVRAALEAAAAEGVLVAPIDAGDSDTAAFCERYGVPAEELANCVVVVGKREGEERYAACVVLATTRADVNGQVKRLLGVRKASFAPMETAVGATEMEYGAITPIGLPGEWRVYVDSAVAAAPSVIVGSGVRGSKLRIPGPVLAGLPGIEVIEGLGLPR